MVRMPWMTCLWPGLPQLWHLGTWWGLALAVGFAVALNVLVLASFVWVEWFNPGFLRLAWGCLGLVWFSSAVLSAWFGVGLSPRKAATAEAMFREALNEYLKENWFEAERILAGLLQAHPRDVEGRLLLATLLRHNRRYEAALEQLTRLELLRDAQTWAREIAVERQWIAEAREQMPAADATLAIDNPSPDGQNADAQRAA